MQSTAGDADRIVQHLMEARAVLEESRRFSEKLAEVLADAQAVRDSLAGLAVETRRHECPRAC